MTIQITRPELEALIKERLASGQFKDAEDVLIQALRSSGTVSPDAAQEREAAIERLKTFGKTHRLSLGGITIRELRHQARP